MSRVVHFQWRSRCRIWLSVLAAALLAAGAFGTAFAQEDVLSKVRISLSVEPPTLSFGDEVTFTLEVTHPNDHRVVIPRLPTNSSWGQFEVREQSKAQTVVNNDGMMTTSQTITAVVFGRGTVQTPDLPISVRGPDGTVEQAFPLPKELIVGSVLPGPDAEPKDIQPQADLSTPILEQPIVQGAATLIGLITLLGVLITLFVIGYFLYRHFRSDEGLPIVDTRTPWEIAIEELDRIERLDLPEDGRFKEHYTLVADAMRVYVQAMYLRDVIPVDAIDMTTDEIWAALRRSSLNYDDAKLVLDLLQEADLVKFAKYTPALSQAYEASGQARYIVEVTRPAFQPEEPSQNGTYAQQEAPA
ncbi:MAG: hypothetical protein F4X72_14365 [Dehalococcoidia bacterium]|nr:hypothetical protein [Dehalococcoidia bacterium]